MSFFHWISGKTRQMPSAAGSEKTPPIQAGGRPARVPLQTMRSEETSTENRRKIKRHARREQMYVAIREAMTRAGVLSASYRFKVLSIDPDADEFFAMMDLQRVNGDTAPQLASIESLIVQSAKLRFNISVSGVYWRVHEIVSIDESVRQPAPPTSGHTIESSEPVQADEVAAFQQALLAASSSHLLAATERSVMPRWGPRFDDFEDTEVTEAGSSPVLSTTQYGDPN